MSVLTSPFLLRFLFIGLFACFSELQHPIRHSFSFRLDFCLHSHCFNVQSDTFFHPFWTSSVTFSTSTSNPPPPPHNKPSPVSQMPTLQLSPDNLSCLNHILKACFCLWHTSCLKSAVWIYPQLVFVYLC